MIAVDFSRVLSLGDVTVRIEDADRRATDGPIRTAVRTLMRSWNLGVSLGAGDIAAKLEAEPNRALVRRAAAVALAFVDRRDADHERLRTWMQSSEEELASIPLIVAELDHLAFGQGGAAAARALREDLDRG